MAQARADVISNGVVQWTTVCDASITSESGTQVNIHVTAGVSSVYASSNYTNSYVWCAVGGMAGSVSNGHVSPGSLSWITGADYLVNKTTSAQSIWCSAKNWMPGSSIGAYQDGAEAGLNIGIPALASHTVTYNANGGSGSPGGQTKWYGSSLTLSSTTPTRALYAFLGWATSASGAVAYAPGGQYGADADVTLYAVWKQLYIPPSFTAADAHRTTSLTSTDTNPDGENAYASFSWAVDTSYTSGNTVKSVMLRHRSSSDGIDGQWLWKRYGYTGTGTPTLGMISTLSVESQGYQSDSATFLDFPNNEDNFIEVWESYATIVTAFTWAVTIQSDDDFSLSIDGTQVAFGPCGTTSISVDFPVGVHRIDFMLREGVGTEGLRLTSGDPLSKCLANLTAPTDLGVAPDWTVATTEILDAIANGSQRFSVTTRADMSAATTFNNSVICVAVGDNVSFDLRLSLYEGDYTGSYASTSLSTFFAHDLTDSTYWKSVDTTYITKLTDGWAHVACDNSSGTGTVLVDCSPKPLSALTAATRYTILAEVRNNTSAKLSAGSFVKILQPESTGVINQLATQAEGTKGTVTTSFAAGLQSSYVVQCIVTDSSGRPSASTTLIRTIDIAAIPIDIGSKGSAVGILHGAPSSGLEVGDNAVFDKNVSITGQTTTTKLKVSSTGCHVLGIWCGSWVGGTDSNGAAILLSYSDLMTLTNGLINSGMMMVYTMNGDMDAASFRVSGGIHEGNTALCACTTAANFHMRINWTFMVLG